MIFHDNSRLDIVFQPLFTVGVLLYAVASLARFRVIATESLNVAYPVIISVTFILFFIDAAVFI